MAYDGSIKFLTDLDTSKVSTKLTSLTTSMKSGFSNIAKVSAVAMTAAMAAVSAFTVSSIKDMVTFDSKMSEVFTLLPGITQDAMDDMKTQVKEVSTEMGVLPNDVIPAVYSALSAGVSQDNVFDFVKSSAKLAKAGVASLDDSVGVLTTATNSYASVGLDAETASNMLFTAVKNGVTSIPELATKLGDVIPTASSLGIGFGDVTASVATLTKVMGKGSTATAITNMKGMLSELGKEGTSVDTAFQSVAGVGFTEFIEKGGDMEGAMKVLQTAAEQNNTSIKNLFSSTEAGSAALILAGDGFSVFSDNIDAMGDSAGAAQTAFDEMKNNTQAVIDSITAKLAVMKLNFASNFAPVFLDLLSAVDDLMDGTEEGISSFSTKIDTMITDFGTTLNGMLPTITKIGINILTSLISGLVSAIPNLISSISYIMGYIVGLIELNLSNILDAGVSIITWLVKGIVATVPTIITKIGDMITSLVNTIIDNKDSIISTGKNILQWLIDGYLSLTSKVFAYMGSLVATIISKITEHKTDLSDTGGNILTWIIDGIKGAISFVWDAISTIITSFVSGFTGKKTSMSDIGESILGWIVGGITGVITTVTDTVDTIVSNFVTAFDEKKTAIYNKGAEILTSFLSGLKEKISDVYDIGSYLVTGLIDGVTDAKDKIVDSAKEFGSNFLSTLRSVLGVHSPSKETAAIGGYVVEGFQNGIEDAKAGLLQTATEVAEVVPDALNDSTDDTKEAGTAVGEAAGEGIAGGLTGKVEEAGEAGTDIGTEAGKGINDALIDAEQTAENNWKDFWEDLKDTAAAKLDLVKNTITILKDSFGDAMTSMGEALYSGEDPWASFASAGLDAIASLLTALGKYLTTLAVANAVTFNWGNAATAAAGAAAAYVASGYISDMAASYDVGGIIDQDQLANIHKGETIIPAGFMSDIKSNGLTISSAENSGSGKMVKVYDTIVIDGKKVARAVFSHSDSTVGLAYQG